MLDLEIERFETIDSTSSHARRCIEAAHATGVPGFVRPRVIVASVQTAGVGQRGRAWCSPSGGLWCTFVVPWSEPWCRGPMTGHVGTLGLRIGLACVRTIDEAMEYAEKQRRGPTCTRTSNGIEPRLKLPNDVMVDGRKVLGVLTEVVNGGQREGNDQRHVLIGVGVNANLDVSDLPSELAATATTLRSLTGGELDLQWLLGTLTRHLMSSLDTGLLEEETRFEIQDRLHARGGMVRVRLADGTSVSGTLQGVSEDGMVVVETGGRLVSGMLESTGM